MSMCVVWSGVDDHQEEVLDLDKMAEMSVHGGCLPKNAASCFVLFFPQYWA